MGKPVIFSVDDEPQVLAAIQRDLRQKYGQNYRIMRANSGKEGLETLTKVKQRNDQVALLISDQRMPEMEGTEFLAEARKLFPEAKKVLLTAYADTEAAIDSINTIELDHYLLKPWDPPEQNLFPVLDELLDSWHSTVETPYDGIRVAGTLWSATSHDAKDFLSRNRIPFKWLDIELDNEAKTLVEATLGEEKGLPVIFFPDGSYEISPSNLILAEKVGLKTEATNEHYELIIIGGGPAGLGAGVYGASEGLKTLMIEREATGGQAGTSSKIENYLGFPSGISGSELARRATDQAIRLGCEILTAVEVSKVTVEGNYKILTLSNGKEISCNAMIIATGVSLRELKAPGVKDLTGAGIYYGAALTEAIHYKDKNVVVVGGANSAGQGAMYFSRFAKKVTMLVRGSSLEKGMSQYLVDQIGDTPNIDVLCSHEVVSVSGEIKLETVSIKNKETNDESDLKASAMFVFIGASAHTDLVDGIVERNRQGFIPTGPDLIKEGNKPAGWRLKREPYLLETSHPGIFAAGDVRQNAIRRVASAVGQGANAVNFVHQYIKSTL